MNKFYKTTPGVYPTEKTMSSGDEYYGQGWSVRKKGDRFYFSYISGELQGKFKEVEISKVDFDKARKGEIDFNGLCIKYNVT